MKEKYAVTIAGVVLNLLIEEPRENLDALATSLETRVRELMIINKRISKTEAAMFCALEYYGEKTRLLAQIRKLEAQAAHQNANVNYLQKENDKLRNNLKKQTSAAPEKPDESEPVADKPNTARQNGNQPNTILAENNKI